MDVRSLTPKEKDKFVEYITTCELSKANNKTITEAFNNCIKDREPTTNTEVAFVVGTLSLLVGFFVGRISR